MMINNKKGLSEVVGYVLLIAVAISMSVIVYYFINSYVPKQATSDCPSSTSMIISNYKCDPNNKEINLSLQNKGLFDIDGIIIRISNLSDGDGIPAKELSYNNGSATIKTSTIYFDNLADLTLHPSDIFVKIYNYQSHNNINKIQIIPFKFYKGESLLCGDAQILQRIEGCE